MIVQGIASVIIAIIFWILGLPQWGLNSAWWIIGASVASETTKMIKTINPNDITNPANLASKKVFSVIVFILMLFQMTMF